MSEDLIRRSDAIKALDANFTIKGKENTQTVLNYLELVRTRIESAPSIDIVRCKECKHWRNTDAEKIPTASIACGNMHADDFCSYGQKGDENVETD